MLSGEATHSNFIVFGWTRSVLEPTIYHTRDKHADYYTSNTVILIWVRVAQSLILLRTILFFSICPSVVGLLAIALSVPLRCTASDYPCGIFCPLHCLYLFDVQLLITPVVSSTLANPLVYKYFIIVTLGWC